MSLNSGMAPIYAVRGELSHSDESAFIGTEYGCSENVLARPRSTRETVLDGVVIRRQEDIYEMDSAELAATLVGQWVGSLGHEANIRGIEYTHSGVGVYYDVEQETVFATHHLCFVR